MLGVLVRAFGKFSIFGIFTSFILIGRGEAAVPQLLVNGDFTQGSTGWGPFFEGAYVVDINATNEADKQNWCPSPTGGYKRYLLFKGWYENGQPATGTYPGAGQTVLISGANLLTHGRFLTVSFNAKFDLDYKADKTVIILKHGYYDSTTSEVMLEKDFTEEINANLGKFHTYKAVYLRPSSKALGGVGLIFQSYNFQCSQSSPRTVILDKITLSQQQASDVGPQLSVKIFGLDQANNGICNLASPITGKSTYYALKIENQGGENLTLSSITLSGTGFTLSGATPTTLAPGATQTCSIIASPSTAGLMSGVLRIQSNDRDSSDQDFIINLSAKTVDLNNDFTSGSPETLGWAIESNNVEASSSTTVTGGSLVMNVNASTYPWSYQISKTFASPGTLNIAALSILAQLKASGMYSGATQNKVEVRLESLNGSKEFATGSLQLGQWVDETTILSTPGAGSYFSPDGKNDRVVVLLPDGGNFTDVAGSLASTAINTTFDPFAPYFRLVIKMTDFDFDQGSNKRVELNYLNLDLATQGFNLSNGGFEEGSYSPPTTDPQYYWAGINIEGWNKYPTEGVAKAVISNGEAVYSATLQKPDDAVLFSAHAGGKSMKVYGQNYYNSSGAWVGPSQTGTVYQEYLPSRTPGLTAGTDIHARGMAMIFSIDSLTGGSTFSYGFKFMDSANTEISRAVVTFTSTNMTVDKWFPLTVNATIPEGTQKIQLISEFIQNAASDKGAVYLDDLSIGFGSINATANVGGTTYPLAWSDEFDGVALNTANWTPELGGGGWGNNEQQTYTSNSDNLSVGGGSLLIQAKKSGTSWTSARIKSQGLRSFKYGKIEFRAKLPTGIGPWPAAWLLGNNISSAGWATCGEIDVMEWRGGFNGVANGDANTVGHAIHSATRSGGDPVQPQTRSSVINPSSAFHTYAVVWTANNLVFSVDGVDKATLTPPSADAAAFQKEFFLILNLAMGGSYVGNTIDPSLASASYEVDYLRVYQAASATVTAPVAPAAPTFSSVTSTGLTVNWVAVSGATSYKLDVSTSSTFAAGNYVSQAQDLTVSGTTQSVVTGLTPGTTYFARVRAVNAGGTSASSSNGTQATLTSYQQYLSSLGYATTVAFNADANGDGVKEGIKYAFNAASPQLGTSPATIARSGSTLTYTFDIRNDSALTVVAQLSTNLTSWADQAGSVITTGTGAATGYVRKIVTISTTEPRAFIRLQVTGN